MDRRPVGFRGPLTLVFAVLALALASLEFTRGVGQVAAVWPVNAVWLAVLLRADARAWPRFLLAGFIGTLLANILAGDPAPWAIALTACNGLEVALAAGLMRRLVGPTPDLGERGALARFLLVGGLAAPAASALAAAALLSTRSNAPFWTDMLQWYAPDALGLLTVTPALLAVTPASLGRLRQRLSKGGGALSLAVLALALAVVFSQDRFPLLFLIPPALILVAFELELAGAALALLACAVVAVAATVTGHGPAALIQGPMSAKLAILQAFLAALTLSVLPVAVALTRQVRFQDRLKDALGEAKGAHRALAEAQRLSSLAKHIAGIGYWRIVPGTTDHLWSDEMYAIHGVSRTTFEDRLPDAINLYDLDSQARIQGAVRATARTGEPFDLKVNLLRADNGERRTVVFRGEAERDAAGAVSAIFGVMRDVTDEELTAQNLRKSEAQFRQLADVAADVIVRIGRDQKIEFISAGIARYGYTPADLIGTSSLQLVHPEEHAKAAALHAALLGHRPPEPADRTYRIRQANGEYVWVEGNPALIRDDDGNVVAIISHIRDVSAQRAAATALAESEARFRLLAESATDLLLQVDSDDNVTYISPSVRRYGYEPADLIGTKGASYIHPEDLATVLDRVARASRGEVFDLVEDRSYRMRTAQGDYVWIEGYSAPVRDASGKVQGVICQLRDVSQRRAAVEALSESEARYRLIADKATDIISRASLDGRFIYLSPSITAVMGFASDELVGRRWSAFVHPEDLPAVIAAYQGIIDGVRPDGDRVRYRSRHKDGHWVWLEGNPTVIRDEAGQVVEFIDVVRDAGHQVQLEAELRAARDEAQSAAATKADFMANMSHEIRTPLTAILGFTSLLNADESLGEDGRGWVARVAGAGQALLTIVNDVLDFSKLEAGLFEIKPGPCAIAEVLQDALLMFQPQADAKGLALGFEGVETLPPVLSLDGGRLRQVLTNLIGNALKFTDAGQVTLAVAYDPQAEALALEVRDSGAGMDEAQQQRLFRRYSQVDASSAKQAGGTGLGLAISRGLVEAMGGEIGVRSQPGAGTTFHVRIPAPTATAAEAARDADLDTTVAGARILVADDNATNRELVRALLGPMGLEIAEAEDGLAAHQAAMAMPYDLILLDVRMPGLSGPEVAARLRTESGPNMDIPILAFTADVDLADLGEGSNFDGIVHKPISPRDMVAAIVQHLTWLRGTDAPESAVGG